MSEHATEGMTFDQAKAELAGAAAQDQAAEQSVGPELGHRAPDEQAAEPTPGEVAAPTTTEAQDAEVFSTPDAEESFMGGDFNPDLLPDELKPGFKQLQAEWTRKTQSLAEERKALEELGSVEELQQAREFYQSLQDPEYLQAFYGELGGVLEELGLSPQEAAAVVESVEAPPAVPEPSPELATLAQTDPELAPFVEKFTAMEQRLNQFEQQQAEREQALAKERQLMAEAQEIDHMVQAVREDHPEYGDDDWQAIYDRAVAYDGDVLQAADRYEADKARIIEQWTAAKQTPHAVTPTTGGNVVTEDEPVELTTLDDAQAAAEAYIAANDLSEFGG